MTTEQKVTKVYQTVISGIETVDQKGLIRDRPVLVTAIIPAHSKQYGLRLSVDSDQVKGFKAGDQVTITVERGGERKTPAKWPSDWYWNLSTIVKGHAEQPTVNDPGPGPEADFEDQFPQRSASRNPPPEYRQATGQDVIQTRISWNSAINNATNLLANAGNLMLDQNTEAELLKWAAWYYQTIIAGPPSSVPAAGPLPVSQEAETPETAQGPGPDPWAIVRASLEQYNADLKAGARQGRVLQYERDVMPRVIFKFGGNLTVEQAATAAAAVAQGSIVTWPTGGKL